MIKRIVDIYLFFTPETKLHTITILACYMSAIFIFNPTFLAFGAFNGIPFLYQAFKFYQQILQLDAFIVLFIGSC